MSSTPVPPHQAPVIGSVAASEDPATAAGFRRMKRRSRLALRVVGGATLLTWAGAWLAEAVGAERAAGLVAVPAVLSALGLLFVAGTQPVRAHDVRQVRQALAGPWQRVEVISLAGAPADSTRRVVVVLDPRTGQPATSWLVPMVRTPRWLPVDRRLWAYLAVGMQGDTAALAPLDRSSFAVLRAHAGLGSEAVHEWAADAVHDRWVFTPPAEPGTSPPSASAGVAVEPGEPRRWPNRPLTTQGRIAVVAGLVALAALLTILGIVTKQRDADHQRFLLAEGTRATAVVVSSHDNGRNPSQIEVEYGTGDGWTYQVRRSVVEPERPPKGASVAIAYDPSNPADIVLVDIAAPKDNFALAFAAWTAVVVVGGRFAWRAVRRGQTSAATV